MILVDTSVWVDHLKAGSTRLAGLLEAGAVVTHPWVIGELALGNLRRRSDVLRLLHGLPEAAVASADELLRFIEQEALSGTGVGYVDAQLLSSARLTPDTRLWTAEGRLGSVAARLGIGFEQA